jgi:tetrapyrrole methylase family protein/MazG family protein
MGDKKAAKLTKKRQKNALGALFEGLVALQTRLRAPGGCPWDREQTHDSLRRYLVEETYEVLDALDSGDPENLVGELGDLLLQIVFHAEIAREARRFDIGDVIDHVHAKMVRRHPHVFGNEQASSSAQVLKNWEQIKLQERREAKGEGKHRAASSSLESILDGVPRSLPALLEAHQLTRRAANVGFDWQEGDGVFDKLAEETTELRVAVESGDQVLREEEIGDLLFVCVNLARFLGFDAEIALKKANRKFTARFREMERAARERGQGLVEHSAAELENLWDEAKVRVAQSSRHEK